MIEILNPNDPWQIPLPVTWEDHDRTLEARYPDGSVAARWKWNGVNGAAWVRLGATPWRESYAEVVSLCIQRGWLLYSMPVASSGQ